MTTTWACYYCTYEQEGSKSQCELCGMPGRRVLNTTITTTEAKAAAAESTTTTIPNSNDGSICSSSSSSSSVDNKSIEKHRQKERFNLFTTATSSNSTTTTTSTSSRKRKISSNCDNGVMKRNSYTSSNNKTKKYERIDILDDSGSDIETDTDTNIKQQNRRRKSQQKQQHQQRQRQQQSTLSFSATNSKSNSISASNADLSHGHIFAHKVVSSSLSARATEYDNYDEEEATEYNNYDEEEVTEYNNYDEDEVQRVMERVFKLQSLRNLQPKAIKCAMEGKSQMIVMATGGGKSLCYQLPACLLGGVSIVISPLLALMKDQTEALNKKGIPAACINSSQTERQNKEILERLVPSLYPKSCNNSSSISTLQKQQPTVLLYITPESIQTERMRAVLKRLYKESRLAMFAVDEAHCLSTWGHDFRSSYRKLNYLRTTFPKTIIMALTATATPKVIQDITKELSLQNCPLHVGSFDRPNIFYKVKYKDALDNPLDDLVKYVVGRHTAHNNSKNGKKKYNREECSGIVYVHKREETSMIARAISKKGISASAYHGGLKKAERIAVQDGWSSGNIQVAVATVAFGMGIDRHCVRYVVHWCLPKSIEGFYQEAGRAGRDGLPSHSLLYYSPTDVGKFKYLIRMQSGSGKNKNNFDAAEKNAERKLEQLEEMQEYCTQMKCRRNTLICHFSGSAVECKSTCDVCKDPKNVERIMQASTAIKDVRRQYFIGGGRGGRGGKKGGGKQPWDGQWNKPHGHFGGGDDDEDAIANDWGDNCLMAGDLRVTGPLEVDPGDYSSGKTRTGFMKASDILSKYESMEGQATTRYGNDYDGFFGDTEQPSRSSTKNSIKIPEHLKASLKAASDFTTANNIYQKEKKATKTLSSTDHAMKAKEIQEKLATIKAQREKKLKSLQGKNTNKPPPPPPAPLSFGRRKRN